MKKSRLGTKKKKSSFVYEARDPKLTKERAERSGGRFDSPFKQGFDVWRPKVGDNLIRILPPTWDDHDHYGFTVWAHKYVGPTDSTYLCPAKAGKGPCAICKMAKESKDAGEADEAKALSASEMIVCWILDRDEDKLTPIIYPLSWTMDRDISALVYNKRTGKTLLIDNPDEGYDLTIKRQGQGKKTKYFGLAIDREATPLSDDSGEQDEILEFIQENPIPSVLHYYDNSYLKKMMEGEVEEKDEDETEEDDDDMPAKKKRRVVDDEDEVDDTAEDDDDEPPAKKKKRPVADDDDDDEPPKKKRRAVADDDDDDEDEPPAKKKKRPVDDDEEDDSSDDEDDDVPPKKKRRAVADDDDDDVAEDDDEDDTPPKKKKRPVADDDEDEPEEDDEPPAKKKKRAVADDDDEDEPAEDDDEDEAPRSKTKRVKRRR